MRVHKGLERGLVEYRAGTGFAVKTGCESAVERLNLNKLTTSQLEHLTGILQSQLGYWARSNGAPRRPDGTWDFTEFESWYSRWIVHPVPVNLPELEEHIPCIVCDEEVRRTTAQLHVIRVLCSRRCHRRFYSVNRYDPRRIEAELRAVLYCLTTGTPPRKISAMQFLVKLVLRLLPILETAGVQDNNLRWRIAGILQSLKEKIMANVETTRVDYARARSLIDAGMTVLEAVLRGERKYDENARLAIPSIQSGVSLLNVGVQEDNNQVKREEIASKLLLRLGDTKQIRNALRTLRPNSLPAGDQDESKSDE